MNLRFLVDSMHGYVAKWLRIMGYDTVYLKHVEDNDVIKLASDGRILVTSDVELAKSAEARGVQVVMIKGLTEEEALKLLAEKFRLSLREDSLRCTVCNGELETVSLKEASRAMEAVPKGINRFWRCKKCGKIYWRGSHWRNISHQISSLTSLKPD